MITSNKNILIITQWSYKDPLIQTYTLPYVIQIREAISKESKIFLVTFEQKHLKMSSAERKIAVAFLKKYSISLIDYSYSTFGIISIIKWLFCILHLYILVFINKINFIHAWCTTAGSLGYVLSKLTGKPLIIDSYEPHAEAMVENKTWKRSGLKFKILFYLEYKLSHHAYWLISATKGMREYSEKKYNIEPKYFSVKPACIDFKIFRTDRKKNKHLIDELNLSEKIVCVYAGKFGGIYLDSEVFDFFRNAEKYWGDRFRALILTPQKTKILEAFAAESGFDKSKMIVKFIPHNDIADYIGLGDFAITPVKPIPTKRYCTPIKNGEYWAMGLPVVITKDISDDSEIIEMNNAGAILKSLDDEGYETAIKKIDAILQEPGMELAERISKIARKYRNPEIAKKIYQTIYGSTKKLSE